MPQDVYVDMHCCMHFSDDWDEMYSDEKYNPSPDIERQHHKFEHIEDGFNKRWKEVVK